jgi:hypothetical protein
MVMARMQIEIPSETLVQLMQLATLERRPTKQQAEVILIRAVSELCVPMLHMNYGRDVWPGSLEAAGSEKVGP